jgi:hypothetical protein
VDDLTTTPLRRSWADPIRGAASRLGLTSGRLVVIAVVAAYFVALAALGGHSSWYRLGVPPVSPPFADMRSVTSAWECDRRGIPVLPTNRCDPYEHRPANYPRIWLWPSALGLGQESTVALGVLVAVVFFIAALFVLPRDASPVEAAIYGLALCTPAVMLGVERGNVDLALFALVAGGVLLLRGAGVRPYAGSGLILVAAVLKLFPIFSTAVFLRRPFRRALQIGVAVVALFALYVVVTLDTIRAIAKVVPQVDDLSFGLRRFTNELIDAIDSLSGRLSLFGQERLGVVGLDLLVAGAVVAVVLLVRFAAPRVLPRGSDERGAKATLDLFWAGAAVYVGMYAFFRSWDYRLVFTLLTIPQLLDWARERRPLAIATLVTLFGALSLDARPTTFAAAAVAQLLLFACYLAALAGTFELRRRRPEPAAE